MASVTPIETTPDNQAPAPVAAKKVPVRLLRHYAPRTDDYEIVGYDQPEKRLKRADGQMIVVQEAKFVSTEDDDPNSVHFGKIMPAPAPLPGVGSGRKLWKGTTIRLPVDEAKFVRKAGIAEIEIDDD